MRKDAIVKLVSKKTGLDKVDVMVVLESFFSEVKQNMELGENVYIRGFGSFVNKKRAKKTARNIKANTPIEIPAHYIPDFKPAQVFKDKIKQSPILLDRLTEEA